MLSQDVLMQLRSSPGVSWPVAEGAGREGVTWREVRRDFHCLKGCHVGEAQNREQRVEAAGEQVESDTRNVFKN